MSLQLNFLRTCPILLFTCHFSFGGPCMLPLQEISWLWPAFSLKWTDTQRREVPGLKHDGEGQSLTLTVKGIPVYPTLKGQSLALIQTEVSQDASQTSSEFQISPKISFAVVHPSNEHHLKWATSSLKRWNQELHHWDYQKLWSLCKVWKRKLKKVLNAYFCQEKKTDRVIYMWCFF